MSGRAVVLGLLMLAAGLAVVARVGRPRISLRPQSPDETASLAVLPFRNLSGEPDLEITSAGITTAVAEAVEATGRASVVPREETLDFPLDRKGIEEAARSLGADYVIAGSLDENNGRVEVDVYLFRAGADPALWVERLDWDVRDRSSIARELAVRIRAALLTRR